jgi:hypothetical protein
MADALQVALGVLNCFSWSDTISITQFSEFFRNGWCPSSSTWRLQLASWIVFLASLATSAKHNTRNRSFTLNLNTRNRARARALSLAQALALGVFNFGFFQLCFPSNLFSINFPILATWRPTSSITLYKLNTRNKICTKSTLETQLWFPSNLFSFNFPICARPTSRITLYKLNTRNELCTNSTPEIAGALALSWQDQHPV